MVNANYLEGKSNLMVMSRHRCIHRFHVLSISFVRVSFSKQTSFHKLNITKRAFCLIKFPHQHTLQTSVDEHSLTLFTSRGSTSAFLTTSEVISANKMFKILPDTKSSWLKDSSLTVDICSCCSLLLISY